MMLCDVIVALPVPGCSWAINCIFIIESRPGLEHLLLHSEPWSKSLLTERIRAENKLDEIDKVKENTNTRHIE